MFQKLKNKIIRYKVEQILKESNVTDKIVKIINTVSSKILGSSSSKLFESTMIVENVIKNNPTLIADAAIEIYNLVSYIKQSSLKVTFEEISDVFNSDVAPVLKELLQEVHKNNLTAND